MNKLIPINEHFFAWQGEGINMGRAAYFVRSQGCPVHCSFCDSASIWHRSYVPDNILHMTPGELTRPILASKAGLLILTGGEPALWDWADYLKLLPDVEVAMETSGAYELVGGYGRIDCLTVSPKWAKLPTAKNLVSASELKLIVTEPNDIRKWMDEICSITGHINFRSYRQGRPVWLHPEWSQRNNPEVLNAISDQVKQFPDMFRAGYQLHKLYACDQLDPNARGANVAPLGGCVEHGY